MPCDLADIDVKTAFLDPLKCGFSPKEKVRD